MGKNGKSTHEKLHNIPVILLFACLFFICAVSEANHKPLQMQASVYTENHDEPAGIFEYLSDHFQYIIKVLTFATIQKASDSLLNPDNDIFQIPRYTFNGEFRPDFSFDFNQLQLSAKPRFNVAWQRWADGSKKGINQTDDVFYVNEWSASTRFFTRLHLSYGRENLQWGPSFLYSPSNPFFRDNGQSNPKLEVAGMDFGRIVWTINPAWTFSAIVNTHEGRQEFINGFEPTYALKSDFTGYKKYLTVIGSKRKGQGIRIGAFTGWTTGDAVMLYSEGSIGKGSDIIYPVNDPSAPFGIRMTPQKHDENSLEKSLLLGISYTMDMGPTFTLEYLYNSAGYTDKEADLYYQLQRRISPFLETPSPLNRIIRGAIGQYGNQYPGFIRQNYLMAQSVHSQVYNRLNLVFRYIHNLDDQSGQFVPIVEFDIGDHFQLFFVGSLNTGSRETEFKSFVDHYGMVGLEYIF